ncbi:1-phosphofructokinase [Evansella sp. AB-rgal1]|uniref:1-phosphofructokinase n=1 Tax=Evansella sp. AB-rgal1 TaxID=3242696 RepID=UPI00359D0ED8
MIYTLTLNPSVDYIVSVENFELGKTNRTSSEMKNPGGKGINVSRVLNNLNIKTKAFGFVGGFTGRFIKDALRNEQIETDFIEVDGDTRINVKLRTEQESEVNGRSPIIHEEQVNKLKEQLQHLEAGDYLILAGSLPESLPKNFYFELMNELEGKGIYTILDTSGDALSESIHAKPFLIKPNHHELNELFGKSHESIEEIVESGKQLVKQGVQNVIVSMAGDGALLINEENVLFGNVPKGTVKNSVGAGDSVVAGFIASYHQHQDIEKAFQFGIASGSATAFSDGFCTEKNINELLQQISIKHL